MQLIYLESLSISHLMLNINRYPFSSAEFRKRLCPIIQKIVEDNLNPDMKALDFQETFFPKGIMPAFYYKRRGFHYEDIEKSLEKWRNTGNKKTIRLVGTTNQLNVATVSRLQEFWRSLGYDFEYFSDFYGRSKQAIDTLDYDMAFMGWRGIYPRPESLAQILDAPPYSISSATKPVQDFLEYLTSASLLPSDEANVRVAKQMMKLEEDCFFVPLFRTRTPLMAGKNISVPSSQFKYYVDYSRVKFHD